MTRLPLLLIAALALLAAAYAASAQRPDGTRPSAREVANLARSISAAEVKNDLPALERIWSDDYTQVSSQGHPDTRRSELEKKRSGQVHFDQLEVKEMEAMVYGEAATTHELLSVKGQIAGRPIDGDVRALRVFVRRDGRWQCVTAQYTRVVQGGQ